MSNVIRLLPDHVANQIAAGEVVQRPASVVKELMENSVDAGATEIKLIVKDAGKTLIQVIDNGKGMSETDARMAFERHATSKITSAEDLFSLNTKGFRGEALASIAAIAHVELKTRQSEDELGTNIIIEGSKIMSQEVAVVPKGTSFSVKNLFFNIPARRNFLKSNTVEFRHVLDEFERIALAHSSISFILIHNGSEMFNLPPSIFRKRIVNIFGGKTNEKLVPVQETTEIIGINGFVGKPEFAKKNRREQFFFVNDRFIKSGYLHHAVISAYDGLLKDGTYPSYFLYLDLPPNAIDINIHPTKTEIKFDDEQALYAILRSAVKHSLGQFSVAPVLDFQRDVTMDTPYDFKDKETDTPTIQIDTNFNPFLEDTISFKSSDKGNDTSFTNSNPMSDGGGFSNKKTVFQSSFSKSDSSGSWETLYDGLNTLSNDIDISGLNIEQEDVQSVSLFEGMADGHSHRRSFQIKGKYIVNPIKSGLVIIDQKKAHQRILYEKFLSNITVSQASSQQLLFSLTLYYSTYEIELLKELESTLKQIGFVFESIDSEKIVISGLPAYITESEVSIVLEDLINDLQGELSQSGFSQTDRISKSLANSLAVKTGTILNEEEQENIVNSLFACKEPSISPFLKPTFITISTEDIDKKFAL